MSLWIQHGYGKGRKIEELLETGSLGGVILSPADETPEGLARTVSSLQGEDTSVLMDPQTYVWGIPDGAARRHEDVGLAVPSLNWSMAPRDIQALVERIVGLNRSLGIPEVLSPASLQRGFDDVWTSLALQFARTTVEAADQESVRVSVVLDESALSDWDSAERWLDVVTALDAQGFYIIVSRPRDAYLRAWDVPRLANLLRIVYRLGILNQYSILLGYTDLDGLTAIAAGAEGIASGWYQSLRLFSESKWQPSTGGRQAKPRITSDVVLSPLLLDEASEVARSAFGDEVFPFPEFRSTLASRPGTIGLSQSWTQHLEALRILVGNLEAVGGPRERTDNLLERLQLAQDALSRMREAGMVFAAVYQGRLGAMEQALHVFAEAEELT